MAEYIIKDKVEWYKCKADITIGDKDFANTGIVVIPVADISELPTIDIVHCGECIHFRKGWTKCKMLNLNGADSDWFCADGARKSVKEVSNKPMLKHADKETLQSAT